MIRKLLELLGILAAILACTGRLPAQEKNEAVLVTEYERVIRPLQAKYCFSCHGATKPKGGIDLASRKGIEKPHAWKEVWERLRSRQMPPLGKPQPTAVERERMVAWIESVFAHETLDGQADPGPLRPRRLNAREYINTVRDLFVTGGKPSVRKTSFEPLKDGRISLYRMFPPPEHPTHFVTRFLPQDTSDGGFDTLAESLTIPPFFVEKHLRATKVLLDEMYTVNASRSSSYQWTLYAGLLKLEKGPAPKNKTQRQLVAEFLRDFASRAFHRPVTADEAEKYTKLFDQAQAKKEDFESSLRLPLQAILVSSNFTILWSDQEQKKTPARALNDHELAARLSYFLWSSLPDEALIKLADKGQLRDEKVFDAQVRRMMGDWRSREGMLFGFLMQWLQLDRLDRAQPDADKYPAYFQNNLGDQMTQELLMFADAIMVEDRSILEFIDADWGFLSYPLAEHYGVKDFPGKKTGGDQPPWYRVKYADKRRGGVLTMGKVLIGTSQPTRTSPVHRGKWVLETILGTPPPPPPPEVDNVLKEEPDGKKKLTVPQLMARHRDNPSCVACHQMIDPLGLAFESFDPTGKWRDKDQDQPIDTRGELIDGTKFNGVAELKTVLMTRKDEFTRGFVEKMLTYALGRKLDYYDVATVNRITQAVKDDGYKFSRVVIEVARSYPFRNCRASETRSK
jgi:mono/diheme cytochrome c family protein